MKPGSPGNPLLAVLFDLDRHTVGLRGADHVVNVAALTKMSGPAVSHHLQQLKAAGLVEYRRDGKETYYRAADTELSRLLHGTLDHVLNIACPILTDAGSSRDLMEQIHDYMSTHLDEKITIDALAQRFHVNTTTLKKEFKLVYGTSIAAHLRMHRMEKAKRLLRTTSDRIADVAAAVGYESQSRFAQVFQRETGMLPTDFRERGVGSAEESGDSSHPA